MAKKLKVGITQGDTNGVGAEIIVKTLAYEGITDLFQPVVFMSESLMKDSIGRYIPEGLQYKVVKDASGVKDGEIALMDFPSACDSVNPGQPTPESGLDAVRSLNEALKALKEGKIDVLVTAPISKENVQSAEFNFPGHTEFLEAQAGEGHKSLMILFAGDLRVALVTTHLPLSRISEEINEEKIIETAEIFEKSLRIDFGIVRPKIALLSVNPHSGDGGLLGTEETEILRPALDRLKEKGMLVFGPFAADGFFGHADYLKYDGILAIYHDQGLAPFKVLSNGKGVNFTAGLPFVRTSPDHGTAFGIAGKGEAEESSFKEAIYNAIDIFRRRNQYLESSAHPLPQYAQNRPDREERTDNGPRHQPDHSNHVSHQAHNQNNTHKEEQE